MRRAVICVVLCLLAVPVTAAGAKPPRITGSISFPREEPLALAVHEQTNRLLVTEDNSGSLYVFDATSRHQIAKLPVGGAAFQLAVNQAAGKAYVASDGECCTTGITQGTGLITVVDVRTAQVLKTIDPSPDGQSSDFALGDDEAHGRIYVAWDQGIGYIDVATDQFIQLQDRTFQVGLGADRWAIDSSRNIAYIPFYAENRLLTVDGATGQIGSVSLAESRARGPLDLEINERENKLYVAMVEQPSKPSPGILILDRDTGSFRLVGNDDLEPLVFNPRTNRLFSGVQVGQRGAIVNGQTDRFRSVKFGGAGMGAGAVRTKSDNAYFANDRAVFAVNGGSRCHTKLTTGKPSGGGLVQTSIAINQVTGRVFVTNRQGAHRVTVIRDGKVPCSRRRH